MGEANMLAFSRMEESYGWDGLNCYDNYNQYLVGEQGPVQVACPTPTGETTAFAGWADSTGKWTQTLSPTATNFVGRVVTEEDPGNGGPDNCWFAGSAIPPITAITGGQWTVTTGNKWEFDFVGMGSTAVNYYRAQGRDPCSVTVPQRMVIDNCSTGTVTYRTNTLGYVIDATTVSSIRDGQVATRNWP